MEKESFDSRDLYRLDEAIRNTMDAIRRSPQLAGFGGGFQGGGVQPFVVTHQPQNLEPIVEALRERVVEGVRDRVAEEVRNRLRYALRERMADTIREQLGNVLREELRQAQFG